MISAFIIGYGNVGRYLADRVNENLKLMGVYDPFVKKPRNADINYYRDINSIPIDNFTKADLIVLAVNDDAINKVTRDLLDSLPPVELKGVIHTSGNYSSTVLEPLKAHFGAKIASFHPYMTYNGTNYPEIPYYWGFEGDPHLTNQCEKIAQACNSKIFSMNPQEKKIYHISGVFASNFLIAHLRITARLLQQAIQNDAEGEKQEASKILIPLIQQTIKNIESLSLSQALSGPLKRNDLSTLRSHMIELEQRTPDIAYLYNFFSIELIDLLESIDQPVTDDIKRFFEV